jgi:hypothetical protein
LRIKNNITEELFQQMDTVIDACLQNGLIPVVAFQGLEQKYSRFLFEKTSFYIKGGWAETFSLFKKCPEGRYF